MSDNSSLIKKLPVIVSVPLIIIITMIKAFSGQEAIETIETAEITEISETTIENTEQIITETIYETSYSEMSQETEFEEIYVTDEELSQVIEYHFRNKNLLESHYDKHGKEMGFESAEEYEEAASDVINWPDALHKKEKEDDDYVYYIEETNEFVVLSSDGYIRTYFYPSGGKSYYDRQ